MKRLPLALRSELEDRLRGEYTLNELARWLQEKGHPVSRSALGEYRARFLKDASCELEVDQERAMWEAEMRRRWNDAVRELGPLFFRPVRRLGRIPGPDEELGAFLDAEICTAWDGLGFSHGAIRSIFHAAQERFGPVRVPDYSTVRKYAQRVAVDLEHGAWARAVLDTLAARLFGSTGVCQAWPLEDAAVSTGDSHPPGEAAGP